MAVLTKVAEIFLFQSPLEVKCPSGPLFCDFHLPLPTGQKSAVSEKSVKLFLSSLTTGHEIAVWPINLEIFSSLSTSRKSQPSTFPLEMKMDFERKKKTYFPKKRNRSVPSAQK